MTLKKLVTSSFQNGIIGRKVTLKIINISSTRDQIPTSRILEEKKKVKKYIPKDERIEKNLTKKINELIKRKIELELLSKARNVDMSPQLQAIEQEIIDLQKIKYD